MARTTNDSGLYSAPLLRPGRYEITIEAPGFRREVRSGIVLQVRDKLRIDFELQLGQLSDNVEVTAAAPLLQSESASTGQVIDSQKITELPLNGRDWLRLGRPAPGVGSTYHGRDHSLHPNGMPQIHNSLI